MKMNRKDKEEVAAIMEKLAEEDLERIGNEVDEMMDRHKVNPLITALCVFLTKHFDYPAIEMVDEDDDQYIAAEEFLRDAMVKIAKRDLALAIFKQRHSYGEVA